MAFINEEISEEDKSRINMENVWSINSNFRLSIWVADRDRDVYLFPLGGGGPEMPTFFGISIQDEIIVFEAARWGTGNNNVGITIFYKVSILKISQTLNARKEDIKQLIREGLEAYGQYGDHTYVTSVNVEFV